jgi:carbon storage regulator
MLVLTRKLNESIIIGENIRITLTLIRGQHVRIAIEAPEDMPILRSELLPVAAPSLATAAPLRRSAPIKPNITLGTTPRKS